MNEQYEKINFSEAAKLAFCRDEQQRNFYEQIANELKKLFSRASELGSSYQRIVLKEDRPLVEKKDYALIHREVSIGTNVCDMLSKYSIEELTFMAEGISFYLTEQCSEKDMNKVIDAILSELRSYKMACNVEKIKGLTEGILKKIAASETSPQPFATGFFSTGRFCDSSERKYRCVIS